jgi:uncharacterized delta-60 repeat protein
MNSRSQSAVVGSLAFSSLAALAILAALAAGLAACSGSPATMEPEPDPTPTASFQLALSAEKLPVLTGGTATIDVTVTRGTGFTGAVTVTPVGLPLDVVGVLEPATIEPGQTRTTLTIEADPAAPHSLPTAVTIRGSAGGKTVEKSLTVTVYGPPGSLDTSFASGGKVVLPVGTSDDYGYAMALQPDGKIVVAGRAAENRGDFALIRLDRDGTLDPTFGPATSPGKVLTDFAGASETAYAIAVQADGKIVVAGTTTLTASGQDFALARYLPDGSLDAGFGSGGKVTTAFSADSDTAYALLVQADGKIIVGGDTNKGSSATGVDFALARYDASGALDPSFGSGGKVITSLAAYSGRDSIYALSFQELEGEARILAAGGEGDFSVARYRANGALDVSFGAAGTGKVTALMGSVIGAARAVRATADGKVVLAGHVSHDFALVRLGTDGRVDATFGAAATPGKVITAVQASNWDEAQGLALDGDGKIVVAGWAYEASSSAGNFAVLRYSADGALDPTFGGTGVVVTPVASGTRADQGSALLLQSDDRIPAVRVLVAGYANGGSNSDFAVTRYWR